MVGEMPVHTPRILGRRARPALCAGLLFAAAAAAPAAAQVRVATYNIAGIKGDPNAIKAVLGAMHADDSVGFAVPVGVFVFAEVGSSDVAALQTYVNQTAPVGVTYALATFTTSGTEDGASGAQALFYRTDMLSEVTSAHQDLATGGSRNTDRWLLQLVGYSSTSARFYVYGSHLKASTGSANVAERLAGVQTIRANADALGAGTRAIYAGDMNFYTNTESGYQAFVAAGNAAAVDPYGTTNWTSAANAWMHSQSPRDIVADGLIGGGMDDRFDFILPTAGLFDGTGLSAIANTCRSLGNDGDHYNLAINSGTNTFYPSNIARSNALATNLFNASDHIPVLLDMQVPAWNAASLGTVPARVVQNGSATAEVRVMNDAPGDFAIGIDPLTYTVAGTGVLSGSFNGTAPLSPAFTSVQVPISTTTVGLRTGTATVTSTKEAVQNPSIALPVSLRVLRRSNPSFSAASDANATTVSFTVEPGSGAVDTTLQVSNFGFDVDQATMDIDAVQVPSGPYSLVSGTTTGVGVSAAPVKVRFNPAGLSPGTYNAAVTVQTSDENIPGATTASVVANFSVTVSSARPGDLNHDGVVDGSDLGMLLAYWGGASGDLNGDGTTDGADLGILLSSWG